MTGKERAEQITTIDNDYTLQTARPWLSEAHMWHQLLFC